MQSETTGPTTQDCVDLLRSLQQLTRARRRSMRYKQDAGALMMLSALEGTPGARVSMLAEMLMIDISAASRQVAALEGAGLVARVRDEADHRAQLVRLTAAGEMALATACETAGSDIAGRISNWSAQDLGTLTDLVRRLATDLVASEPGCAKSPPAAYRVPAFTVG
ncbi:MarR family winged helix-turn-helix transcriptional regulator [Nakamurella panacisegetis]|uniref:MarR family winged helix-turn-helix transcriptional regulator n=1 Tax=Nakamurella panacisegetis TaxID=1090615 RepID=UPI0012FD13BC|nr:MarR family winged helix-turn-helix transcriptional regulator [Nakamurella panacisegetis]